VKAFKIMIGIELAGFMSCRLDPKTQIAEVGYNAVNPQFLGRGIGKILVQSSLRYLRESGAEDVEVVTGLDEGHAPARAVYESAGFKPFLQSVRYTLGLRDT